VRLDGRLADVEPPADLGIGQGESSASPAGTVRIAAIAAATEQHEHGQCGRRHGEPAVAREADLEGTAGREQHGQGVEAVSADLLFAFGLMLFAFRSLVVAAKAVVLNLLSVAAAYGVLVLVFPHVQGRDGIEVVLPLLLFVILFGLSMDYHVFIISRIREAFDRGEKMDDAVAHGITSTAGVVTSAAIVMCSCSGCSARCRFRSSSSSASGSQRRS
jgi:hypothetical protein